MPKKKDTHFEQNQMYVKDQTIVCLEHNEV